jgi:hypothetical protein
LSFCIKNMDETKTLLIKSMFQDWKWYPVEAESAIAFNHKNPNKVRLSSPEWEIEVRVLFI